MPERSMNATNPEAIDGEASATKSRRRILQVGAALAAGALASTMLNQQETSANKKLGVVQGESDGLGAGVAGINTADGDGVLGIGVDGPAIRAHNFSKGVALRAETKTTTAIDAQSEDGIALRAESAHNYAVDAHGDETYAIRGTSANYSAILGQSSVWDGVVGLSAGFNGVRGESGHGTGVFGESPIGTGVYGESTDGAGVRGRSTNSTGVHAQSNSGDGAFGESIQGVGVRGKSNRQHGVSGYSVEAPGVFGASDTDPGVRGYSAERIGVEGLSPYGTGVEGYSVDTIGVRGHSFFGIGVLAEAHDEKGKALQVQGRGHFETAGNAIIPSGSNTVFVGETLTTEVSHVSASLMGHPAPGSNRPPTILYVERQPGVGFDIYLTGPAEVDTRVSYLVVEPVATGRISTHPGRDG